MKNFLYAFLLFPLLSFSQPFTVDTIYFNGDPSNRINILIIGDGYQASEIPDFRADAQSVADYFFNTPPYNVYRDFFNFFTIDIYSNDSGNDHPGTANDEPGGGQPVTSVDNFLQTTFDNGGIHRCVYSNQSGQIYSIANTYFPQWDFMNVIVNTQYYGGCAGTFAFTTMHSSSAEIFVHEFGHMFGDLADEYDDGTSCSPGTSQAINVSQQTDTSQLVWRKWLTNSPIPTPNGTNCGTVGLYEGANYCATNWYRPKCDCKMRSLFVDYCEVCEEQLIYKISTLVNYIESSSPLDTIINLCSNESKQFDVTVLNNTSNTIRTQWFLNNTLVSNNAISYLFDGSSHAPGVYEVKVIAYDTTIAAKRTLTFYQKKWTVIINMPPVASVSTSSPLNLCFPGSALLNIQNPQGLTYKWMRNNIVIAGSVDSIYTVSSSGNYVAIVSDGSCSDTSQMLHFNVYNPPSSTLTVQGNDSVCSGSVVLNSPHCNSCRYQWQKDLINIPGASQFNYSANVTGNYSFIVTDTVSNCQSSSAQQYAYVSNFNAAISPNQPAIICDGDSVVFNSTPTGFLYQWRDDESPLIGETNEMYVAHLSGDYDVIVSDGLCPDTTISVSVVVNISPVISFSGITDTVCLDGPIYNLFGIPFGGTFSGDGIAGSDFFPTTAGPGVHTVTYYYIDANGCSATFSKEIFVEICTGIESIISDDFLIQPNPARDLAEIKFNLKNKSDVHLTVYNSIGEKIYVIDNTISGVVSIPFDLTNKGAGIFIVELSIANRKFIRKLAVVK